LTASTALIRRDLQRTPHADPFAVLASLSRETPVAERNFTRQFPPRRLGSASPGPPPVSRARQPRQSSPQRGVTSVAPSTPVVLHDRLDSQGFSRLPALLVWRSVTGVKPTFMILSFFQRLDTRRVQGTVAAWHGICLRLRPVLLALSILCCKQVTTAVRQKIGSRLEGNRRYGGGIFGQSKEIRYG
jgi:hypothetical protein